MKKTSRIRKSLLKKWSSLVWRTPFRVVRRDGVLWLVNRRNFVDRHYAVFGLFEKEQRACFFDRTPAPFDAMIDVGANFGLYAVLAAAKGWASEIHAFEPDPRNRAQLQGNLYLNGLTQTVTVHDAAVSAEAGMAHLSLHDEISTGTTRISADRGQGLPVRTVALDDVFPWRGRRVAIKMDIEGHEVEALKGMSRLLRENDCWIQVESFGDRQAEVAACLQALGYVQAARIEDDFYFSRATAGGEGH